MVGRYEYDELREKALNGNQEDINKLGEWFENYGECYWNGEFFDADNGIKIIPDYTEDSEGNLEVAGYKISFY